MSEQAEARLLEYDDVGLVHEVDYGLKILQRPFSGAQIAHVETGEGELSGTGQINGRCESGIVRRDMAGRYRWEVRRGIRTTYPGKRKQQLNNQQDRQRLGYP